MITVFASAALAGFGVSTTVTWLIAGNASRLGLMDAPNQRSSHSAATPRGGGIGIVAGVGTGMLVLTAAGIPPSRELDFLILAAAAVAVLGFLDDLQSLPAVPRLLVQLAIAIAILVALGDVSRLPLPKPFDVPLGWIAWPFTILWLMGVTNFYNFMDGIDGLAGAQVVASCVGIAIAGWALGTVEFSVVLASSTIGFLLFNFPPARIFLGDVGSTSLGFAIAATPLLAPVEKRPAALLAVALGLSLFLLDPLETLVRLLMSGHKFGAAHRLHSYQRIATSPRRATWTTAGIALGGLCLSVAGGLAYRNPWIAWGVIAAAISAFAVEWFVSNGRALRRLIAGKSKT
jgi:UDP-N-acetylmuramyl pentapeptide phosphotransferase/UDP-N-acetylglucosamine-1-phosphate transferase